MGSTSIGPHGDGAFAVCNIPQAAGDAPAPRPPGPCAAESAEQEVDSACLSVIGYPAWGVEDPCVERTMWTKIGGSSGGRYGYQTAFVAMATRRWWKDTIASTTSAKNWPSSEAIEWANGRCSSPMSWSTAAAKRAGRELLGLGGGGWRR